MVDISEHKANRTGSFAALFVLAMLGLVAAWFSLVHHVEVSLGAKSSVSFCNINATFNCDAVNASSWSTFLGVPLASYGFAFYAFVIVVSIAGLIGDKVLRETSNALTLVAATIASILSGALIVISKQYIGAICLLCMAMHAANFLIWFVAFRADRRSGALSRLVRGCKEFLFLPAHIASGSGSVTLTARIGLLAGIACVWFLYLAPYTILGRLVIREQRQQSTDGVAAWQARAEEQISINTEGMNADHILGEINAPITIVEFSDFECPACQQFAEIAHQVVKDNPGKVRVVFKNFPLDNACNVGIDRPFHLGACYAAEYARCAGEQDAFWRVADQLFAFEPLAHGSSPLEHTTRIDSIAASLGLDSVAIDSCMKSDRHMAKIKADIAEGLALQLAGTPLVYINGRKVESPTEDTVAQIVSLLLK